MDFPVDFILDFMVDFTVDFIVDFIVDFVVNFIVDLIVDLMIGHMVDLMMSRMEDLMVDLIVDSRRVMRWNDVAVFKRKIQNCGQNSHITNRYIESNPNTLWYAGHISKVWTPLNENCWRNIYLSDMFSG